MLRPETRKEAKHKRNFKIFDSAWHWSGKEVRNDKPYLSRSALIDYIMKEGLAESEDGAKKMCQESQTSRLIGTLVVSEMVSRHEHGWVVICADNGPSMMISRSEYK
jgi:hypothetical protein